ncbi:CHC2 zinc finger domain-containing protein, partial [Ruminococcus sp.]
MPFPESFLQELKLRSDITEIASSYVNLKRHGRNMVGLC